MLKSIEISGFKSFGKKVSINIDSPITAIVGPNGSGKSNVVEAFRFVLGEQSIKSLRGKGQMDLLFKGSKNLPPAKKLKVSINFDNKNRVFNLQNDIGKNISFDFDTITLSRELYADNKSVYLIQNTEVRLKDLTDLLSSLYIGASSHHIISQGEADRVLLANTKERRAIIDEALGLKIYENRIRESERKIEKSKQNILEIEASLKELLPHSRFLEKQVQKLREIEDTKRELSVKYFNYEKTFFNFLKTEEENIKNELKEIAKELETTQFEDLKDDPILKQELEDKLKSLNDLEEKIRNLLKEREILERNLGRTEGVVEALTNAKNKTPIIDRKENISIPYIEFKNFFISLKDKIKSFIENKEYIDKESFFGGILNLVDTFEINHSQNKNNNVAPVAEDNTLELEANLKLQNDIKEQIIKNISDIEELNNQKSILNKDIFEIQNKIKDYQNDFYAKKSLRGTLENRQDLLKTELLRVEADFLHIEQERILFAPFLIESLNEDTNDIPLAKELLKPERLSLERLRAKAEEFGGGSGGDIIKEYEDTKQRIDYLKKELADIDQTIGSLTGLIKDLRVTMREDFKLGIDKINEEFKTFFQAMFGGGNAFLSLSFEVKKNVEDFSEDEDENNYSRFEKGIDIHVDLPNKKIQDLNMLSGGERSLVSIALLFAISQVNPPPFLILDETDAALDEANSRRYGDMLSELSKKAQLIVVTHNRETMSRAGVIYGVTMGLDAVSKMLSIELKEAVKVAK